MQDLGQDAVGTLELRDRRLVLGKVVANQKEARPLGPEGLELLDGVLYSRLERRGYLCVELAGLQHIKDQLDAAQGIALDFVTRIVPKGREGDRALLGGRLHSLALNDEPATCPIRLLAADPTCLGVVRVNGVVDCLELRGRRGRQQLDGHRGNHVGLMNGVNVLIKEVAGSEQPTTC